MRCMVGDAYVVDNMDSVSNVWVGDSKRVESIKLKLNSNLNIFEVGLVSIFLDQVCW